MTLNLFRDAINKAFQERIDAARRNAISMRFRPPGPNLPAMTAEEYAMTQVERLCEARVLEDAIGIVTAEYRKMTQPEEVQRDAQEPKQRSRLYG